MKTFQNYKIILIRSMKLFLNRSKNYQKISQNAKKLKLQKLMIYLNELKNLKNNKMINKLYFF